MALSLMCVALLAASASGVELAQRHALFNKQHKLLDAAPSSPPRTTPGAANCSTRWITQSIDHFGWNAAPNGAFTWQQRYLVNTQYWRPDATGAVFFYVGNEGDVTLCAYPLQLYKGV